MAGDTLFEIGFATGETLAWYSIKNKEGSGRPGGKGQGCYKNEVHWLGRWVWFGSFNGQGRCGSGFALSENKKVTAGRSIVLP